MPRQWEKKMSDKKWYKLVFKQIQPIHIGAGSYGVIGETRIFIPGWTMWGALTKAYNLRKNFPLSENQELFKDISCFYPAFKNNHDFKILFPKFNRNGKFCLGEYSEDEFRAKFVDTFMSTAIEPLSNTALDESLHELNVILPGAKAGFIENDKEKQLYWVGVVQIDDPDKIPRKLFIGGDTKYGLGEMVLENNHNEANINEWINKDGYVINYLPINYVNQSRIEGRIELLVEIKKAWEQAELKVKLRNGEGFFYMPGTRISVDTNNIDTIEKGILTYTTADRGHP